MKLAYFATIGALSHSAVAYTVNNAATGGLEKRENTVLGLMQKTIESLRNHQASKSFDVSGYASDRRAFHELQNYAQNLFKNMAASLSDLDTRASATCEQNNDVSEYCTQFTTSAYMKSLDDFLVRASELEKKAMNQQSVMYDYAFSVGSLREEFQKYLDTTGKAFSQDPDVKKKTEEVFNKLQAAERVAKENGIWDTTEALGLRVD